LDTILKFLIADLVFEANRFIMNPKTKNPRRMINAVLRRFKL